MRPLIQEAEQSISNQCRQIKVDTCENQLNVCESELTNNCGDVDTKFKNDVDSKIDSLEKTVDNFEINIANKEIKANHVTSSDVVYGKQDPSCECKPGKLRETAVEKPCEEDPSKICQTKSSVCDEYYKKATVTCNYAYFASAKIGIEIIDKSNKYLVYDSNDGNIGMRNMQLNFDLISGSY